MSPNSYTRPFLARGSHADDSLPRLKALAERNTTTLPFAMRVASSFQSPACASPETFPTRTISRLAEAALLKGTTVIPCDLSHVIAASGSPQAVTVALRWG